MKKALLFLTLFVSFLAIAQNTNTNCWQSSDYVLLGNRFNAKGIKKVTGTTVYLCFNDGAASFYTKETGLITFNYKDYWSGIDSANGNKPQWYGQSLPNKLGVSEYHIKMTYNHQIHIDAQQQGWSVIFRKISHTTTVPKFTNQ